MYIRVNMWYLSFSFWLTSLCMTGSRFIHACSVAKSCPIHIPTNDPLLFLFMARKMALMNLFAVQEYRCRHREKTCGHREGRGRWDICWHIYIPDSSAGKESACNAGDLGLIPGLGRSPGEGKGYPLQYSGLENSMDCIVYRVAESRTRLSDFHSFTHSISIS